MTYPLQPIINIAELCVQKGVQTVVLSPGSRNAPLVIAFARHPALQTLTVSDERTAAFIALGIAQQTARPVVLCCTSGSAGLNYAPAIAEAFYQQIPLLVLTADRPPEWIDQLDGQTIRQRNLFGQHVKAAHELPVSYDHPDTVWQINRIVNEALNEVMAFPQAPVHINCPFREPFYPTPTQTVTLHQPVRVIKEVATTAQLPPQQWQEMANVLHTAKKIVVVAGQQRLDTALVGLLNQLPIGKIIVINDCIANLHGVQHSVQFQDFLLAQDTVFQDVDLLLTFGKSVLSKAVKGYFRKYRPVHHWHIQLAGQVADTFQSIDTVIRTTPYTFFEAFVHTLQQTPTTSIFASTLELHQNQFKKIRTFIAQLNLFSELGAVYHLLRTFEKYPQEFFVLHLANSMTVRYVNALGISAINTEIFCNRGTSGIDGSTSTAIGHALAAPEQLHFLVTGDVAFFYDRNAFWHNYLPNNLRIVLLNNGGGGIFKLIDAGGLPEADEYFVTRQTLNGQSLAQEFGLVYHHCTSVSAYELALKSCFETPSSTPQLIEIQTSVADNQAIWQAYKRMIQAND